MFAPSGSPRSIALVTFCYGRRSIHCSPSHSVKCSSRTFNEWVSGLLMTVCHMLRKYRPAAKRWRYSITNPHRHQFWKRLRLAGGSLLRGAPLKWILMEIHSQVCRNIHGLHRSFDCILAPGHEKQISLITFTSLTMSLWMFDKR